MCLTRLLGARRLGLSSPTCLAFKGLLYKLFETALGSILLPSTYLAV
jgi:hypothetical protein